MLPLIQLNSVWVSYTIAVIRVKWSHQWSLGLWPSGLWHSVVW
jgi:hypothetical protein